MTHTGTADTWTDRRIATGGLVSQEDFRINASVRSILSRWLVSTSRLDFGTTNGVVYLRGTLLSEEGVSGPDAPKLLGEVEREIRTVPGVRDVVFGVTGWRKARNQWVRTPSNS
jgi:osmotically-inducible protein OsmY